MWTVALSEPWIGPEEEAAVLRVLRSGWLSLGPETAAFEEAFAAHCGLAHAVAVSSGTAALHLALTAAGIGPGDEVILPSLTFVATAHAVLYCGAQPVLADVESERCPTLDPADVARKISARTRAILPMHYAGALCDMAALRRLADDSGLPLIEDAAHAAGVPGVGTSSLSACFSFYANKNLCTGEGGMLVTNDAQHAATARQLRAHGLSSTGYDRWQGQGMGYDVTAHGFSYRITDMQSALGRVQLTRLADGNERRTALAAQYRRHLNRTDVAIPFDVAPSHLMVVLLPEGTDRPSVRTALAASGIQTSVHYPPVHRLAAFARYAATRLPITDALAPRLLSLPLHARLSEEDVHLVCDALAAALGKMRC